MTVEEPGQEETIAILNGLKGRYEEHHKVIITDDALKAAVKLSARYINDRFLPDKAIDLVDEASSKVRLASFVEPEEIKGLEKEIEALEAQKEAEEYNNLCEQRNGMQEAQTANTTEQDRLYKYLVAMQEEYNAAKEGAKNSADTERKIETLQTSINETQDMSRRYNVQLKSVIDTLEMNIFFPKLASGIANEVNDIIRQKELLKREAEGVLTPAQLKEVTGKNPFVSEIQITLSEYC